MSNLNWRCCAKNLRRYRHSVEILFRDKCYSLNVIRGTYYPDGKHLSYYDVCGRELIPMVQLANYEYVTLGEL